MNFSLPNATRRLGKSLLETVLPIAERITGFQTAPGEYLPYRLKMLTGRYEAAEIVGRPITGAAMDAFGDPTLRSLAPK